MLDVGPERRRRVSGYSYWLCAYGLILASCGEGKGCGGATAVARLADRTGKVESQRRAKEAPWKKTEKGEAFYLNDAVRTGAASRATVEFTVGGRLRMSPQSLVRFLAHGQDPKDYRLRVETGGAEIESGGSDVLFETRIGLARLESGSKVRVGLDDTGMNIDILVGKASIERENDKTVELGEGKVIQIDLGGVVNDPKAKAAVQEPPPKEPTEEPPVVDTSGAGIRLKVSGKGVRVRGKGEQKWRQLPAGTASANAGDALKVKRGSHVEVSRGTERATLTGDSEAELGEDGKSLLRATSGKFTVEAGSESVRVEVPGGAIVVRAAQGGGAGRAELGIRRGPGTMVLAKAGIVEIRAKDTETLTSGESATLKRDGTIDVGVRIPKVADFGITAGESPLIHDPQPPTAIRVKFKGICSGEGVLEVPLRGKTFSGALVRSRGDGSAIVGLAAGMTPYRIRCLEGGGEGSLRAKGLFRVSRDSGRAQLPKIAPKNFVDADGRKYTVLYQNLLPELIFSWPRAPSGSSYTLNLDNRRGSTKSVATPAPKYSFATGDIGEGTYDFWFETNDAAHKKSPKTTLRVGFDNAAPSASIKSPPDVVPRGATVKVAGVALEGWKVSVGGADLPLDEQHRFEASVVAPTDENVIAIRIAHPSRGVHYYLRRVVGGKP